MFEETVALGLTFYGANKGFEKLIEAKIKTRAEELSRQPGERSDLENWLAAEREVLTRERATEIARGREARFVLRAEAMARAHPEASATENWLAAQRELDLA